MSPRPLKGQLAVVTGSSRGIGLAIAQALAREGASLVLVARDRKLALAAKQVGGDSVTVAADVTRPADVRRLFATIRRRYGRLDVLVNNAGGSYNPLPGASLAISNLDNFGLRFRIRSWRPFRGLANPALRTSELYFFGRLTRGS